MIAVLFPFQNGRYIRLQIVLLSIDSSNPSQVIGEGLLFLLRLLIQVFEKRMKVALFIVQGGRSQCQLKLPLSINNCAPFQFIRHAFKKHNFFQRASSLQVKNMTLIGVVTTHGGGFPQSPSAHPTNALPLRSCCQIRTLEGPCSLFPQ